MEHLAEALRGAQTVLQNAQPYLGEAIIELVRSAQALVQACHKVGDSRSGSFKARVEQIAGGNISIDKLEADTHSLRSVGEDVRRELLIELSSITFDERLRPEETLLKDLERLRLGRTKEDIGRAKLPKGTTLPAHVYYEAVGEEALSLAGAIETLLKMADQLILQLEKKKPSGVGPARGLEELHPEIRAKCYALYKAGAYAEAVETSFKAVRDRLRNLTGFDTGSEAFGKGKLHIRGAAGTNVEEDFNEAVKFLTLAVDRFRNEKSHSTDAKIDDPTRAYEYLTLSSLAVNLLEQAEIREPHAPKE